MTNLGSPLVPEVLSNTAGWYDAAEGNRSVFPTSSNSLFPTADAIFLEGAADDDALVAPENRGVDRGDIVVEADFTDVERRPQAL